MSKRKAEVSVTWVTTWGQKCTKFVAPDKADAEAEHLRTLPDVRTETVQVEK